MKYFIFMLAFIVPTLFAAPTNSSIKPFDMGQMDIKSCLEKNIYLDNNKRNKFLSVVIDSHNLEEKLAFEGTISKLKYSDGSNLICDYRISYDSKKSAIFPIESQEKVGQLPVAAELKIEFATKPKKTKLQKPLIINISLNSLFLKKLSLEPELTKWERTVPDSQFEDQIMNDHDFESLKYSLKGTRLVLETNNKPYSFQKNTKCQIEDNVVLLGKSYINTYTKSQLQNDLSRAFELKNDNLAEIALLESKISIPSKNVKVEVIKNGSDLLKEIKKVEIKDGYFLEVTFDRNFLSFRFLKGNEQVSMSEISPFSLNYLKVYNGDKKVLKYGGKGCFWGIPRKLSLSIPMAPRQRVFNTQFKLKNIDQARVGKLIKDYKETKEVAEVIKNIFMVNHKLPNDGKLKFSENLAALYYLNPNNQLITQNYSAEIAKADPKGAEEYKYIPKPFKGYYITLNSKIEEIDGSLKNISKLESSPNYLYNDEKFKFIGSPEKEVGLMAIPVDPERPTLYSNLNQFYKFQEKPVDAKPENIWQCNWKKL